MVRMNVLLLLLVASCIIRVRSATPSDVAALLAQKQRVTNWDAFAATHAIDGWTESDAANVCQWSGVTCQGDQIVGLSWGCAMNETVVACPADRAAAQGTLAPELAELTALVKLDLSGQAFSGTLPDDWGRSGAVPSLQFLWLDDNRNLTGPLPSSWGTAGAFPQLTEMSLSRMPINGSLPPSWGSAGAFPKLKQLWLNGVHIVGAVPPEWSAATSFPSLEYFSVEGTTTLCGPVPAGKMSAAICRDWEDPATGDYLVDPCEDSNGQLRLCGLLTPEDAAPLLLAQRDRIDNWKAFYAGNSMVGWKDNDTLPVCQWTGVQCIGTNESAIIQQLDWGCYWKQAGVQTAKWQEYAEFPCAVKAVGSLAPELANITTLTALDFSGQNLMGTLPEDWAGPGLFKRLQFVYLQGNIYLTGPLSAGWASPDAFPSLIEMNLHWNNLTGTVPEEWGTEDAFPVLQNLVLYGNPTLCGEVPENLAPKVCQDYDPERNGIVNSLNSCFPNSTTLHCPLDDARALLDQRDLIVNWDEFSQKNGKGLQGWSEESMASVCSWSTVSCVDGQVATLNWNCAPGSTDYASRCAIQAEGALSPALGSLIALTSLDMQGNSLVGTLPPEWGSAVAFPRLSKLYLSLNNSLTGSLPESWGGEGAFPALTELKLSRLQLNGSLPEAWGSPGAFSRLQQLWIDNNRLSGAIPTSWSSSGAFPNLTLLALAGNQELCGAVPVNLLPAVCREVDVGTSGTSARVDQCQSNSDQLACSAQAPVSTTEGSSSSTPVGAIVGGVIGGVVVLAVLAFFALRPGKGWLRRQTAPAPHTSVSSRPSSKLATPILSLASEYDGDNSKSEPGSPPLLPGSKPLVLSMLSDVEAPLSPEGATRSLQGSVLRDSRSLPDSYVSTGVSSSALLTFREPGPRSVSQHSLGSDPLLSFISTRLAAQALPSMESAGSGGRAARLPAAVRLFQVTWEELQLVRQIGKGSFGRVYLGKWRETDVAIKVLIANDANPSANDLELPETVMHNLQEEAAVMSRMRHPNLVSFMGLCTLPPCILTEYCALGSLYDVLRQGNGSPECAAGLTWERRLGMALDAARGLLYLHLSTPALIHCDVKSPNILVDSSWRAKVGDFNLTTILKPQGQEEREDATAFNPIWLAPEVMQGGKPSAASDVYSFGMVLYELLTWTLPWHASPYKVRRWVVLEGLRPEVPSREELPGPDAATFAGLDDFVALMQECWAQEAEQRPTFQHIVPRLSSLLRGV